MTWNTESIFSMAIKRRKRGEQSGHKYILKSRRPSVRHYANTPGSNCRSKRYYSPNKKKPKPASVEISLEVVNKDAVEESKEKRSSKLSIVRYCERFANGITKRKTFRLHEDNCESPGKASGNHGSSGKAGASIECVRAIDRSGGLNGNNQLPTGAEVAVTDSSVAGRPEQSPRHSTGGHKSALKPLLMSSSSSSLSTPKPDNLLQTSSSLGDVSISSLCTPLPNARMQQTESESSSMENVSINDRHGLGECCADEISQSCSLQFVESDVDTGPEITTIPDIRNTALQRRDSFGSERGQGSPKKGQRSPKKGQRSPEKSHRSLYSCVPCRTVGEPSSNGYQTQPETISAPSVRHQSRRSDSGCCIHNKVMCTLKPKDNQRRKASTSWKGKHRFTLRAKDSQSEITRQDSKKSEGGFENEPSLSIKQSIDSLGEDEISLQDIDVEIDSDSHSNKLEESTDCDSVLNAIQNCIHEQELSPKQERVSSLPKKSACYISARVRRPRQKKIKVCVHRRPRKILVIGDMTTGKTNLISAYIRDRFTENYVPTILNCHQTDARISGEAIDLVVLEVSGRDDYQPLRRRAYRKMDAAIVCYSINSPQTLQRVRDFWVPELKQHAPLVPFLVVGTKKDIRDEARDRLEEELANYGGRNDKIERGWSQGLMEAKLRGEASFRERYVSREKGKSLAERVGAEAFLECSSLYRDHTREVFETTTKIALRKSRRLRTDNRSLDAACIIL